jgi:heterogeneous nuclear ribonucleoprotein A1/A3
MLNKIMMLVIAAGLTALLTPSRLEAWGAAHVGVTRVGPGGVYHAGRTAVAGPGGVYAGGRAGYAGYGGYRAGYGYSRGVGYGGAYGYRAGYAGYGGAAYGARYGYIR